MEIRPLMNPSLLVLVFVLALSGCAGTDTSPMPVGPSLPPPQTVVPVVPPRNPAQWPGAEYTLTAASLSGVIYEASAGGNSPLAGAMIYCELCGEITHTWATTDLNGVYRFPGELANGGGVWLAPGKPTPITVGGVGFDLRTWVGQDLNVIITGDTRLDVVLLRR